MCLDTVSVGHEHARVLERSRPTAPSPDSLYPLPGESEQHLMLGSGVLLRGEYINLGGTLE